VADHHHHRAGISVGLGAFDDGFQCAGRALQRDGGRLAGLELRVVGKCGVVHAAMISVAP